MKSFAAKLWGRFGLRAVLVTTACLISAGLMVSIPTLSFFFNRGFSQRTHRVVTRVEVVEIPPPPPKSTPERLRRKPRPKQMPRVRPEAGPRFAVDLGVVGPAGAPMGLDLLRGPGESSPGAATDGVDERPKLNFPPPFSLPPELREAEVDARALLSFCVDRTGRVFDVQVVEESPAGLGLARAAREALRSTTFQPAAKGGLAVPFCGMEQPFEVKWDG